MDIILSISFYILITVFVLDWLSYFYIFYALYRKRITINSSRKEMVACVPKIFRRLTIYAFINFFGVSIITGLCKFFDHILG